MNILIAEQPENGCSITRSFEMQKESAADISFDSVETGKQALAALRKGDTELLLLDLVLCGVDGFTVLERMNAQLTTKPPRVFVCSALCCPSVLKKAFALGAVAFYFKPFDETILARRVLEDYRSIASCCVFINNKVYNVAYAFGKVACLLNELGVPPQLSGRELLRFCIMLSLQVPDTELNTASLYAAAANRYGSTPARVERSIRQAIESTWNKGSLTALNKYFGYSVDAERGRPTNSEFIARARDALIIELNCRNH